jgi:hypothetical protein
MCTSLVISFLVSPPHPFSLFFLSFFFGDYSHAMINFSPLHLLIFKKIKHPSILKTQEGKKKFKRAKTRG